ncbi:MAG: hypothetical protein MJ000_10995 [Bacteroidales bacterium]|nr:hypothetical protein [Bacteroidales bacterium]
MAEQKFRVSCGFFNSVNGDRRYTAEEMNRPYRRVVTNGVFATPAGTASTDLQVMSAGSGMTIKVKAGEGIFANKWFENPSDFSLTVTSNTSGLPRRDSIIVQVDNRNGERAGNIVYREGIPSANPQPPDIGTVDNVIEYRVANIYVASGATAINQDAIVDLRGSSECPWVTSLIKQVDTSALWIQYRDAFSQLYHDLREEALSLTTLVRSLDSHYQTTSANQTVIPIGILQYNRSLDILEVRVNGLVLIEDLEYTIDSNYNITLTDPVDIGTMISFRVFKSVDGTDAETVVSQVNALQQLVNSIDEKINDEISDTDWITFVLESGAQAYSSSTTPSVRKRGSMVHVRGCVKNITSTGSAVATLPLAFRPSQPHYFTQATDGSATVLWEVGTNGVISMKKINGTVSSTSMIPMCTNFIIE